MGCWGIGAKIRPPAEKRLRALQVSQAFEVFDLGGGHFLQVDGRRSAGPLAADSVDGPRPPELVVGALGGIDADLEVLGEAADRGEHLPPSQVPRDYLRLELPRSLLVNGVGRRVGDQDFLSGCR